MFTDPNSPFYAAITIGSTKVTGMVGRVDSEGVVNVLSYMAISSTDFIRKGRVYNVDKMTQCLKSIRERMENQLNCNIKQVYVALNCQGMRSTTHLEERTFPQRITVQQELIESLKADNRDKISQDQILIDSIPLEYTMGTFSTNEAVGVMTDRIRAQFLNIICNAGAIETIESSFRKAGLPIARHTMAADRLANVMTDEKERSTGCVFVDMGSETTTVAVYRGKLLRHFAVLPLGGLNITRDIAGIFNCEESEAEEFKRTYGYPEANRTDDNSEVIHLRDGGRARPLAELYDIIEARTSEIVQNIKAQIEYAGYDSDTLVNGLYITGGAAQLPHLNVAFAQYFPNWNVHFDRLPNALAIRCNETLFNENAIYNVVLSVIRNADSNCNAGARAQTEKEPVLFKDDPDPSVEQTVTPETNITTPEQVNPQVTQNEETTPQEKKEEKEEQKEEKKRPKENKGKNFLKSLKSFLNNMVTDDE